VSTVDRFRFYNRIIIKNSNKSSIDTAGLKDDKYDVKVYLFVRFNSTYLEVQSIMNLNSLILIHVKRYISSMVC